MGAVESRLLPMVQDRGPSVPPVFDRVAIVGLGLVGGSIALAVRKVWPASLVIGVDRIAVLERAMIRHAIDVASEDLMIISDADLVILATPVEVTLDLIPALDRTLVSDAVVTDVSSTKNDVATAARMLPQRLPFVGGHPLTDDTGGGIDAARPDLFAGRPWLLVDETRARPDVTAKLVAFAEGLGATPVTLASVADHDRLVSYVRSLPSASEAVRSSQA
jgi:prephenate dehydrogenase